MAILISSLVPRDDKLREMLEMMMTPELSYLTSACHADAGSNYLHISVVITTLTETMFVNLNPKLFTVYITTNYTKTVLYTGVTNNLEQRITEHFLDKDQGKTFAGKYKAYFLIYFETYDYILNAIAREKQIKGWRREKKLELIFSYNKELKFLNEEVFGLWPPKEICHRKELE